MKRDIKDFVSQKRRSKYHTVNYLSGFLDAQNANLFVMYVVCHLHTTLEGLLCPPLSGDLGGRMLVRDFYGKGVLFQLQSTEKFT
jgi:hypothetical protein